jgi:NADH dehydrogenase [ubiquinone] 1 alpha subcomplex assembly factor 7
VTPLAAKLRASIAATGPMRLDRWMEACNGHYYASRDPLGAAGDFTTAPEISQMFGELIGGWIADLWLRAGSPAVRLVELGPGRGTLMADALRVLARVPGLAEKLALSLVETSPVLRAAQTERLDATWFDSLDTVPDDLPMIVIANEFFDALPIRQGLSSGTERAVDIGNTGFVPTSLPAPGLPPGEHCAPATAIIASLAARLAAQGGAALIIDYGNSRPPALDTLQALRHHGAANPFADPGESDLTAHVDFSALAAAAANAGARVTAPVPQGVWLGRLGIEARAAALKARATTAQAAAIEAALVRLTAPVQMGQLFKAMAITAPHWPQPAGFAA